MSKLTEFKVRYAQVPVEGIRGKIIRHTSYNDQKTSINGWCWLDRVYVAQKPQFMEALCDSISAEGVRNPVIVYAAAEGDYLSFGGSRLTAARQVGFTSIPALVNDYCGRYEDCPEVTEANVSGFFTDIPKYLEFTPTGVDSHYFMERNRRGETDPAGYAWMPEDAAWVAQEFPWINRS